MTLGPGATGGGKQPTFRTVHGAPAQLTAPLESRLRAVRCCQSSTRAHVRHRAEQWHEQSVKTSKHQNTNGLRRAVGACQCPPQRPRRERRCPFGGPATKHESCPLRDIPSRCCFFTGPWTVTRSSLRMLRRVAAVCWPLRPVLPLVSFPRLRSPVVGVPGLCWLWHGVPFAR